MSARLCVLARSNVQETKVIVSLSRIWHELHGFLECVHCPFELTFMIEMNPVDERNHAIVGPEALCAVEPARKGIPNALYLSGILTPMKTSHRLQSQVMVGKRAERIVEISG
jgi:hypothetical protein